MDSKKTESLLKKYWAGETTLEEELLLKALLDEESFQSIAGDEQTYFELLKDFQSVQLPDSFDSDVLGVIKKSAQRVFIQRFLSVAATVAILLSAGYFLYQKPLNDQIRTAELQEAREAFELTKQALMLVSVELNRGAAFTQELGSFDEAFEKIKTSEGGSDTHN